MNTFVNALSETNEYKRTENGATAHNSTHFAVYDMFAFGGAYRKRSDADIANLFKKAYEEDKELALKCLFYLRDCRGGQGERRFFRVAFRWLISHDEEQAYRLLDKISEYGRWDDLIYCALDTELQDDMVTAIREQFALDLASKTPSLLGKWMPSENASSPKTKRAAKILRQALKLTSKEYRVALSSLRTKINIVEKLMSENRWDEIEFDKIPSKAGLMYKNAFARRDIIAKKYEAFAKSKDTKVNAKTLYPYEIVQNAIRIPTYSPLDNVDRLMVNKYWENLPDYFNGKECSMMCVVDTSGSMRGTPINMAISLGLYCAERLRGPFANRFITFSSRPQFIETTGVDFVAKVQNIYRMNIIENTNLLAVFELLKKTALRDDVNPNDVPETIVVISDMEIDEGTYNYTHRGGGRCWDKDTASTEMERVRKDWASAGLKMPKLVYWNVNARHDTILDLGPNVSCVSGSSPTTFESILTGKTGYSLMLDKLLSDRYASITAC